MAHTLFWVKFHRWALALALLVGIISVAPQIFFSFSPSYKGIQMFGTDGEDFYIARIHEIYEGHLRLGNVFLRDKDRPYLLTPLAEILVGGIGMVLSLSAVGVAVLSKMLFPFFLFLFFYFLVYKIFSSAPGGFEASALSDVAASKSIAIVSASLFLLGENLLSNFKDIAGLAAFTTTSRDFLLYTRPIHPEVSSLFLLSALYFLWKVVRQEAAERRLLIFGAWLGAVSGLAIYAYVYPWSFLLVSLFLSLAYSFFKNLASRMRALLLAIGVHMAVTVPYWLNFFEARMYSEYPDAAMRIGLVPDHAPVWGLLLVFFTAAVFLLWPKQYAPTKQFFAVMVLSSWIVTNQQIITGVKLQVGHYHWYIVKPLVGIALAAVFVFLVRRFIKNRSAAIAVVSALTAVFFYNAVLIQFFSYRAYYAQAAEDQRYAALIEYVRDRYGFSQIIWSDVRAASLLPMYTIHDVPNSEYASVHSLNPKEYLVRKVFFEYRLRGVRPDAIGEALRREEEYVVPQIFGIYYHGREIPQEIFTSLEAQYKEFYRIPYAAVFRYFDIDLIVWDKKKNRDNQYERILAIEKIDGVGDDFLVYKPKR